MALLLLETGGVTAALDWWRYWCWRWVALLLLETGGVFLLETGGVTAA